ncbi:NAD(P)-dependent oxidoreductase [Rhizobium sp. CSW-27]|uniref:DUF1932 domain-containing protein n=1 Tax=Rhizobium sp. CSW-27 TaxID=2839985 RepID=UPI002078C6D6|nr:NAD(P)-dependent oxidoreductase [Rhizobium sp. CSW-27]
MMKQSTAFPDIAMIGFGEAAHAIAGSWRHNGRSGLRTFDRGLENPQSSQIIHARCEEAGVEPHDHAKSALAGAGLVISLVTADEALAAAIACAPHLEPGSLLLDGNSCAPETKIKAASVIEAAGAHYVDMAVMAPVYPRRHEVPLLLAGKMAKPARNLLLELGMRPEIVGTRVGDASTIKMLRSVMIKGLEALTGECFLAARRAGVEDAVLASLKASDPEIDWSARASYNLERMLVHGERRAAEMEEVCKTLQALGLPDWMSRSTIEWQRKLAELDLEAGANGLTVRADRILKCL